MRESALHKQSPVNRLLLGFPLRRYSDTADSDWLISYHDKYPSLFLATGDSGHAFKVRSYAFYSPSGSSLPPSRNSSLLQSWASFASKLSRESYRLIWRRHGPSRRKGSSTADSPARQFRASLTPRALQRRRICCGPLEAHVAPDMDISALYMRDAMQSRPVVAVETHLFLLTYSRPRQRW